MISRDVVKRLRRYVKRLYQARTLKVNMDTFKLRNLIKRSLPSRGHNPASKALAQFLLENADEILTVAVIESKKSSEIPPPPVYLQLDAEDVLHRL